MLADHGARRELAQALAEGVRRHVADLRRRVPGVDRWVVQLDEPALPAVLGGRVPTASGFSRHRTVQPAGGERALGWVVDAVREGGGEPWLALLRRRRAARAAPRHGRDRPRRRPGPGRRRRSRPAGRGAGGGESVVLGVVPSTTGPADDGAVTERVHRWLDMLGLEPGSTLGISPACGLAGADAATARRALELVSRVAASLG